MVICNLCKKRPATIHLTDLQNNVKKELHMCEECAQKKGFAFKHSITLPDLSGAQVGGEGGTPREKNIICGECSMTWQEFRKRGRFGCANCYTAFRKHLQPLLADIHARADEHLGKGPVGDDRGSRLQREMIDCRRRLRDAVEREDYLEAAELRDRLAVLEKELGEAAE